MTTTKIIGSVFVPKGYTAFVDANGRTICLVMVEPVFRVLVGDPLDERIVSAKVAMSVLADFAKSQIQREALDHWEPQGVMQ